MDPDKNSKVLEKQLKTLGQQIRIEILKKLYDYEKLLSFSMLQKQVVKNNLRSVNFSFHLKALKEIKLISSSEDGYSLTFLGKQILENILSIEQILNEQNKTIMIRTSKYSKEPFDIKKVQEYLIKEGKMEEHLAQRIAQEVKIRLSNATIEYLTAPLMREYINGILLENDLEEIRHKLTRLGTPPYEARKLFKNGDITPDRFINKLGSDVSEQFLLLNLIPKNLADLYLSGEIALLHLNYWSLRPLSLFLKSQTLLDLIIKKNPNISLRIENSVDYVNLIINFIEVLKDLKVFFSEDILLREFNYQFLSLFHSLKGDELSNSLNILTSQLLRTNGSYEIQKPHLTLDFIYRNKRDLNDSESPKFRIDNLFFKHLFNMNNGNSHNVNPLIQFDYSNLDPHSFKNCVIGQAYPSYPENLRFYNKDSSNVSNSQIICTKNSNENIIILDKILVNLHLVALEANQSDDRFFDLLREKIASIFELFKYKQLLVQKKLTGSKKWNDLLLNMFEVRKFDWNNDSFKSISFFGLNEAVKHHCGIALDRIDKSETFALNILNFMRKIINEKNNTENSNFIFSQPHNDSYLEASWNNGVNHLDNISNCYTSCLIRQNSKLSLNKKIQLFKKFENEIDGGSLFSSSIKSDGININEVLNTLFQSNLSAFSLTN